LGRSPKLLRSDKHDDAFYHAIENAIRELGYWRGEIWGRRKNGEVYPEWKTVSIVKDSHGCVTHHVAVFSDISDIKASEQQLEYLAHHDPLTELPNRLLFTARLNPLLVHPHRLEPD